MVTIISRTDSYVKSQDGSPSKGSEYEREVRCLSTDTKPTSVPNGTLCLEIDTGDVYVFDKDSSTWVLV